MEDDDSEEENDPFLPENQSDNLDYEESEGEGKSGSETQKHYFSVLSSDYHENEERHRSICQRLSFFWQTIRSPRVTLNSSVSPTLGVGVALYFQFLYFLFLLTFTAYLPWFILFLMRAVSLFLNLPLPVIGLPSCFDAKGKEVKRFIPTVVCAGSVDNWKTNSSSSHAYLITASVTCVLLVACIVVFSHHHRVVWKRCLQINKDWVSNRSVLISSLSLKGMLPLVPNSQEICTFFTEKLRSFDLSLDEVIVSNVLMILDIGFTLRLRRKQERLREIGAESDAEHGATEVRTEVRGLAKLRLCQECRSWAKDAARKRRLRFERYANAIDNHLDKEGIKRDIESTGCAIVTFESEDLADALLESSFSQHQNRKVPQKDHAKDWWFSEGKLSKFSLGDGQSPLFVRKPPEPNDINFEAFTPSDTPSHVPFSRKFAIILIGFFSSCISTSVAVNLDKVCWFLGNHILGVFVCCCLIVMQTRLLVMFADNGHVLRPNSFATFTLEQKNTFEIATFFSLCSLLPVVALGSWGFKASPLISWTALSSVILIMSQCYVLLSTVLFPLPGVGKLKRSWDIKVSIPLGRLYAESLSASIVALAIAPSIPYILPISAIFNFLNYLVIKSNVLCNYKVHLASNPRFGADISVRVVQWFPYLSVIHLGVALTRALQNKHSHYGVLEILGIVIFVLISTFCIAWHWKLLYAYETPSKSGKPGAFTKRFTDVDFRDQEDDYEHDDTWTGATISFDTSTISSNSRDWQAALSLKQIREGNNQDSLDDYRLPWVIPQ